MQTIQHPMSRHAWRHWRLFAGLAAALLAAVAVVLLAQPSVDGVRSVIRLTARSSLLLFLLAFTASAAARHWPGGFTGWQLRQRRSFGLAFAVSHALHLAAIATFAVLDPAAFQTATSRGTFISGGLAYAAIAAMTVTSFAPTVAWLGPQRWRRLHWAGGMYIWLSFVVTFGKRLPLSPGYALPVLLLVLALLLRLWPRRGARAAA